MVQASVCDDNSQSIMGIHKCDNNRATGALTPVQTEARPIPSVCLYAYMHFATVITCPLTDGLALFYVKYYENVGVFLSNG